MAELVCRLTLAFGLTWLRLHLVSSVFVLREAIGFTDFVKNLFRGEKVSAKVPSKDLLDQVPVFSI